MDMNNTPNEPRNDISWAPGYQIIRPLQQSSRVQLFVAVHNTSEIHSAIKVITDPKQAEKEIDTLRNLSGSPGIVPLHDVGRTTHGHLFLVFPLYPERSFGQVLSNSGPVSLTQAVAVGRNVGAALAGLHSRGLLHNAVAPENILSGNTSLLTGFSSITPDGSSEVPIRSSEGFLHAPPEATRGEQLSPASDVYRLASTLWTLLMGRTPLSDPEGTPLSDQAYTERILTMNAPPVARRDISRVMSRVLTRAMAKDVEDRYQSAGEFALALERARTGTAGTGGSAALSPSPHPARNTHTPKAPEAHNPPPEAPRFPSHPAEVAHHAPITPGPPAEPPPNNDRHHLPAPFTPREETPEKIWDESQQKGQTLAREEGGEKELIGSPPSKWSRFEGWTGDASTRLSDATEGTDPSSEDVVWDDLEHEPRWRKQLNIAVAAAGVMFFAAGTGIVMILQPGPDTPALAASDEPDQEASEAETEADTETDAPAEPSPPPDISAPTGVVLEDNFSTVTLTWTDNSGGTASYFILAEQQGRDPLTLARTGPGGVTAQVTTEEELAEYCFTVIAVDGAAALAEEVCTTRAADLAELEEPAEEVEEEEEEDEEADPSPSPSPDADD